MTDHSRHNQGIRSAEPLEGDRAATTPTIEDVFELLADEVRREVCLYFTSTPEAVLTVEDLLSVLGDGRRDRDRLAIDLHHRHLPKLDAAGLIEYDARSKTARYWGQPTVEKWAEHVRAVDERD